MPANDPTVDGLFPELANVLGNWSQYGGGGPSGIPTDEHGGVTDDQVAAYIAQRMSNGQPVGPSPLVSGQQQPVTPQFVPGQTAAPPAGGMEGTGGEPQQPQPQPSPPPPPAPQPPPEPQPSEITPEQIQAYAKFDEMLASDPQLHALIVQHLQARQGAGVPTQGGPPPAPVAPSQYPQPQPQPFQPPQPTAPYSPYPQQQPQPQPLSQFQPPVPQSWQPSAEDLAADPVLAGIWNMVTQQQAIINNLNDNVSAQQEAAAQRQLTESTSVINQTVDSYAQQRALTPEKMQELRSSAAQLGILNSFLSQGVPLADAVVKALDTAYWADEELRNAAYANMAQNQRATNQRKAMAGAVAGSSGSVPRTFPISENPTERRQQMTAEIDDMMRGSWANPDT